MSKLQSQSKQTSQFARLARKSFVSTFVVATYMAYALHERFAGPTTNLLAQAPQPAQPPTTQNQTAAPVGSASNQVAQLPVQPASLATTSGQYKNGTYTGSVENAFYGQVQVQVTIQGGKISTVQFLNFPQDRRTSQRINSVAVPTLQTEAVQAQSANVDVVSGATLTSQAFMASLQTALNGAQS
jgi:uncharacterized protein with FMN-binding domain